MRTSELKVGLFCGLVGVLASSQAVFAVPTVTLKAVKKNNVAITPTTDVTGAVANDTYECEAYISGWADTSIQIDGHVVRTYQFQINGEVGAGDGKVIPVGWNAPVHPTTCQFASECTDPLYPTCQVQGGGGICVGPGTTHNPSLGASIDTARSNFILFGFTVFGGISTPNLNYTYGETALQSDGAFDSGDPFYAGTLILKVGSGACGDYVWGFVNIDSNNQLQSFIVDETPQQDTLPLTGVPLTIHAGTCPVGIGSTTPPVCTIDARFPSDPNNVATRFGFNTLGLTLTHDPGPLTAANFQMSVVPSGPDAPVITNVAKTGLQVTLTFQKPIPSPKWSCAKLLLGEMDVACIGTLGGDTDASKLTGPSDTIALIGALDGDPALQIWQTDLDRSGTFSPIDIIASIDLLNGAAQLNSFNGASIPTCPTVGIP